MAAVDGDDGDPGAPRAREGDSSRSDSAGGLFLRPGLAAAGKSAVPQRPADGADAGDDGALCGGGAIYVSGQRSAQYADVGRAAGGIEARDRDGRRGEGGRADDDESGDAASGLNVAWASSPCIRLLP